jgi:hypothetical protein
LQEYTTILKTSQKDATKGRSFILEAIAFEKEIAPNPERRLAQIAVSTYNNPSAPLRWFQYNEVT